MSSSVCVLCVLVCCVVASCHSFEEQQLMRSLLFGPPPNDALLPEEDSSQEEQASSVVKRRKGPTLSVVSPLEVLRQRLRLDRAKERIRENQKQISANEQLLERIGKRAALILIPPQRDGQESRHM